MVSVIIPVFNTEKYVSQCIQSIVSQTYRDIEIILINDGSTDSSGLICGQWSRKDTRIRYVEKENEGQGIARNIGIQMAQGEYIIFVDSDDFIDRNLIQESVEHIEKNSADICIYTYKQVGGEELEVPLEFLLAGKCSVAENEEVLSQMPPMLCTKLFRARLLKASGILMRNVMCEDLIYQAQVFIQAGFVCTLNKTFYNYRYLREGNLSTDCNRYFELTQSVDMLNRAFADAGSHEKYWVSLYSLSFSIFKIFLTRVHKQDDFNLHELKAKYYQLLEQYSACLQKWFHPYIDISLLGRNYLLIGSYSLRVMLHAFLLDEEHLRQDYSASSIISMMSRNIENGNIFKGCSYRNAYRKRHIMQDMEKKFRNIGLGHAVESIDYIVIDMLEEIADLIKLGEDCYITESPYFKEMMQELHREEYRECERISFLNPERRGLFRKYAADFVKYITAWNVPVILVKNFLCERHSIYYDVYTEYPDADWLREVNRELEWCYVTFAEYMPQAIAVGADGFRNLEFTHDKFPFGCEPIYYNAGYYRRMGIEMNGCICKEAAGRMGEKSEY